jgi:hypothetical protein
MGGLAESDMQPSPAVDACLAWSSSPARACARRQQQPRQAGRQAGEGATGACLSRTMIAGSTALRGCRSPWACPGTSGRSSSVTETSSCWHCIHSARHGRRARRVLACPASPHARPPASLGEAGKKGCCGAPCNRPPPAASQVTAEPQTPQAAPAALKSPTRGQPAAAAPRPALQATKAVNSQQHTTPAAAEPRVADCHAGDGTCTLTVHAGFAGVHGLV